MQPIEDHVIGVIGPTLVADWETCRPTPLLKSLANAISDADCRLSTDEAAHLKKRFPVPPAAPVHWEVGLRPTTQTES